MEAGELGFQDQPWIHNKFQASLGYIRLSPKGKKRLNIALFIVANKYKSLREFLSKSE